MVDRRTGILDRYEAILSGLVVPGFMPSYFRNRGEVPDDKRPCIILLDGHEVVEPEAQITPGRVSRSPCLVNMITEVWVVLEGRKPLNENVGRDLNTFRIAILDGILNDSQLEVIVNARGGGLLRYESMMTDMAEGLTMEGKLGIKLFARYPLIPAEFKL